MPSYPLIWYFDDYEANEGTSQEADCRELISVLKSIGYEYAYYFTKRKAIFFRIQNRSIIKSISPTKNLRFHKLGDSLDEEALDSFQDGDYEIIIEDTVIGPAGALVSEVPFEFQKFICQVNHIKSFLDNL